MGSFITKTRSIGAVVFQPRSRLQRELSQTLAGYCAATLAGTPTSETIDRMSQFYLIRSRSDGDYLVAHPNGAAKTSEKPSPGFLLMFREHFDALSYLNTHGSEVADRFAVESIPDTQLNALLKRWGFTGVGMVQDPLLPEIDFLIRN